MSAPFKVRSDVERVVLGGFAYPLGVAATSARPPGEGYCITWMEGQEEAPDTYSFCVVVSHERLKPLLSELLSRLPDQVMGIMEVGSRDAFRAVDVFLSAKAISIDRFLDGWLRYEPIFLEDASLAVGVNADEPFLEIFVDQDKRITVHIEPKAKDDIEAILARHKLHECDESDIIVSEDVMARTEVRPVLVEDPNLICDVDQLLLALRYEWMLVLDEDEDHNLDAGGRNLGRTFWHAVILLEPGDGPPGDLVYGTAWASAGSRRELEWLIRDRMEDEAGWSFREFYTLDRVAFDDRPEELSDRGPKLIRSELFSLKIEAMDDSGAFESDHG